MDFENFHRMDEVWLIRRLVKVRLGIPLYGDLDWLHELFVPIIDYVDSSESNIAIFFEGFINITHTGIAMRFRTIMIQVK